MGRENPGERWICSKNGQIRELQASSAGDGLKLAIFRGSLHCGWSIPRKFVPVCTHTFKHLSPLHKDHKCKNSWEIYIILPASVYLILDHKINSQPIQDWTSLDPKNRKFYWKSFAIVRHKLWDWDKIKTNTIPGLWRKAIKRKCTWWLHSISHTI